MHPFFDYLMPFLVKEDKNHAGVYHIADYSTATINNPESITVECYTDNKLRITPARVYINVRHQFGYQRAVFNSVLPDGITIRTELDNTRSKHTEERWVIQGHEILNEATLTCHNGVWTIDEDYHFPYLKKTDENKKEFQAYLRKWRAQAVRQLRITSPSKQDLRVAFVATGLQERRAILKIFDGGPTIETAKIIAGIGDMHSSGYHWHDRQLDPINDHKILQDLLYKACNYWRDHLHRAYLHKVQREADASTKAA